MWPEQKLSSRLLLYTQTHTHTCKEEEDERHDHGVAKVKNSAGESTDL